MESDQPPTTDVVVVVTVLYTLANEVPVEVNTPIAAAEIKPVSRPYSMAVAPDWSLMILLSVSRHMTVSIYIGSDIQTPWKHITYE